MKALSIRPIAETPESVTLSRADYEAIRDLLEDAADLADVEAVMRKMAAGETEAFPAEVVDRLLEGMNPVLVMRRHRGMTGAALSRAAGVSQSYLSEIEQGRKPGSLDAMRRLAAALRVPMELLAAAPPDEDDGN
ncbi:MAG TPA: helix-turn-helix transcriptional regulator [Azospirillaceae bacterium]|nr:helix-turn-helix transcriptional regulator [Azospirillaceae bacterium]